MAKPRVSAGGGLPAVWYVVKKARDSRDPIGLYRRLRSRNTCKTCALGMGGQRGGMVNEAGHFPEICKKSVQAQAGDMGRGITEATIRATPLSELEGRTSRELEAMGRVTFPMIAREGDTHFTRVSWEEALAIAAGAFREVDPAEAFFYASGRASNEAAFLLQLVARAWGTANIHNCSYYCHQASGVALGEVYGSGTASVTLEDLAEADLAVVAGANPASNHPRLITKLVEMKQRGGRVIVVNPLRETGLVRFRVPSNARSMVFGSKIADIYLQPHAGGDVALFMALLKGVIEAGAVDGPFVDSHTSGWAALREAVAAMSWPDLIDRSGVAKQEMDEAVALLARSRRGIFMWAMGLTHHVNGVDNILALSNLALARGWLGRPGCGLLPIRGHSNVQGVGSMGVSPGLRDAFRTKLDELYGITVPAEAGQDTYASMVAASEGRIGASFQLGGNLFASNPDRSWAAAALRSIGCTVSVTTKLNEGHLHGRGRTMVILPALARDEEGQATTQESMFNYVRLSEGGEPSVRGSMRSEVEIIAALAERILPTGRFDWATLRSHQGLRKAIAAVVPGYDELAGIDRSRAEFQVGGRTFHAPSFARDGGRAQFHVPELPAAPAPGELRLMTLRSEGQFNTVVYDEEDLYRGNRRRDVVMISAADAGRLALAEGDLATVTSEAGELHVRAAIVDIRAGTAAMYYPEANALVPRRLDPRSKTPAFKCVPVSIRKGA